MPRHGVETVERRVVRIVGPSRKHTRAKEVPMRRRLTVLVISVLSALAIAAPALASVSNMS